MSEQRVGTCSICGGDVVGYRGAWMSVTPPPPDQCSRCGARRADDVIEMARPPAGYGQVVRVFTAISGTEPNK